MSSTYSVTCFESKERMLGAVASLPTPLKFREASGQSILVDTDLAFEEVRLWFKRTYPEAIVGVRNMG